MAKKSSVIKLQRLETLHNRRNVLITERTSLKGEIQGIPIATRGSHMADQSTDSSVVLANLARNKQELSQVNGAIEAITSGQGLDKCSCGKKIPAARREAVPHARLCLECQDKDDKDARLRRRF